MNEKFIARNSHLGFVFASLMILCSCSNPGKLIYKTRADGYRLRFFENDSLFSKKYPSMFFARVDSDGVKIQYNFFKDEVTKSYSNDDNLLYILNFGRVPMSFLTDIDQTVLSKADALMDSLHYKDLMRAKGATGYLIEVLKTP